MFTLVDGRIVAVEHRPGVALECRLDPDQILTRTSEINIDLN